MIRAEELLGLVRPPKWTGPKSVVRNMTDDADHGGIEDPSAPRHHRSKAEAAHERALWDAIGAAMKLARDRAKWTQVIAAERMSINNRMLCDYERGKYAVPERAWDTVRDVLGVDIAAMVAEWRTAQ